MSDELEFIRQAASRILARDPELAREAQSFHPGVVRELIERPGGTLESMMREIDDPVSVQMALETIVSKRGRPVLTIRSNDFTINFSDVESEIWRSRLTLAHTILRRAIPSVGRVDLDNNPSYSWVGTAWLIADGIAVTNRHVAEVFAAGNGDRFLFRTAFGASGPMAARVDFLEESQNPAKLEFQVKEVLHIEPEPGPDLAFLAVESQSGPNRLATPINLATAKPAKDQIVAAIGYPARDSRIPDQDTVIRLFGDIYDKKRLAPGQLLSTSDDSVTHDCSTLGGNSGSVLLNLETGEAVGLHFAGLYLRENYAVPAAILRDRLSRLRRVTPRPQPPTQPVPLKPPSKPETGIAITQSPPALNVSEGLSVTWTLPLSITVTIGTPTISPPPGSAGTANTSDKGGTGEESETKLEKAVAEARRLLQGRDDVVGVRPGYRFKNGWITDERAVVVLVKKKKSVAELRREGIVPLPTNVLGVPVDVTPASPFDLLEMLPAAEALERAPETHYRPPTDVQLEEVDEPMKVICHVSPDAGWTKLSEFLAGTKKRLTVGMYDFTAPHIVDGVKDAVKAGQRRLNLVIQHGSTTAGDVKKDDIPDEDVVEQFNQLLRSRFKQAWASVSGPNRLFASAYHIKVAVKDSQAFWLSSGNWQSSNQPAIDPVGDGDHSWKPLRTFDRDWHSIIENDALAKQYEKFLLFDLEQAASITESAAEAPVPMILLPMEYFDREEPEIEAPARYFAPKVIDRRVRVRPLLTPDNYQREVLELIRGATSTIFFQNQSLSILDENDDGFQELLDALKQKQTEISDVRIIIRGDFNPRPILEKIKAFGFDMGSVRVQNKLHNKGIVVDSDRVAIGSHNWTNQGTLVNRDASLIFFDPEIARYYEQIFLFDWDNLAKAKVLENLPAPEFATRTTEVPSNMIEVSLRDLVES